MPSYTQYTGGDALGRGISQAIWGDFPYYLLHSDPSRCRLFFDDFMSLTQAGIAVASFTDTTDTTPGGMGIKGTYDNVLDGSVTATILSGEAGATGQDSGVGDLQIDGGGTDNDFAAIGFMDFALAGFARHGGSSTVGVNDQIWFEARMKVDSVADNAQAWVMGMAEIGAIQDAMLVDNTGVFITTLDFVGWQVLNADGNAALPVFQEGGNTKIVVGTGTNGTGAGTFAVAADTWIKFGYKMIGNLIIYYVDGGENSRITVVSTDNFPDVNRLCPVFGQKLGAAAAVETNVDWWMAGYFGDG